MCYGVCYNIKFCVPWILLCNAPMNVLQECVTISMFCSSGHWFLSNVISSLSNICHSMIFYIISLICLCNLGSLWKKEWDWDSRFGDQQDDRGLLFTAGPFSGDFYNPCTYICNPCVVCHTYLFYFAFRLEVALGVVWIFSTTWNYVSITTSQWVTRFAFSVASSFYNNLIIFCYPEC